MPELRAALEAEPGVLRILGRAAPTPHLRPVLRKPFEERLRVLQVGRIESLGEPAVDLCQHSARFVHLAPLLWKASQTHHGSEFERLRALAARDVDGVAKASLGFG